jgi:hypothetical protein
MSSSTVRAGPANNVQSSPLRFRNISPCVRRDGNPRPFRGPVNAFYGRPEAMPDRFHVSPWGVHPDPPRAGGSGRSMMERWWARVGRIFPQGHALGGPVAGGGVATAADPHARGEAPRH